MADECRVQPAEVECLDKPYKFSFGASVTGGAIALVISFVGSVLNFLTAVALLRYRRTRREVTTLFVVSLALSDLLFSGLTLPLLAIKFLNMDWVLGDENGFWCQAFPVLFYVNSAIKLFNLLVVTIHRALMIYSPDKCESVFTRLKSKIYILLCWTAPLLLMLPSLTGFYGHHGLKCMSRSCTILRDSHCHTPKYAFLICGAVMPTIVLAVTNTLIKRKVRQMRRQMEALGSHGSTRIPKGLRVRENRITNMMIIVYGCFLLTYWPAVAVKVLDDDIDYGTVHIFFYVLNWSSVIMNPIIYATTQERYRAAYRHLFVSLFGDKFTIFGSFKESNNATTAVEMKRQRRESTAFRSSVSET